MTDIKAYVKCLHHPQSKNNSSPEIAHPNLISIYAFKWILHVNLLLMHAHLSQMHLLRTYNKFLEKRDT